MSQKSHRITIRLSDKEYERIKQSAKKTKLSMAEYVREQVSKGKIDIMQNAGPDITEFTTLTSEFHRIGINLNQISHHLNAGDEMTGSMQKELTHYISELKTMRDEFKELLRKQSK